MGARISSGFTIIETMLFLAVTGLLIMGVLVGTGASLNNQRYRDSVETFKNLVQTQYAELGSIRNDRSNTWACDSSANAAEGGTEIRGQSNCVIAGRYMVIHGSDISIYSVLAVKRADANDKLPDIEGLAANYNYSTPTSEVDTKTMEWGTEIAWPKEGDGSHSPTTPRSIGMLFIRSPSSGGVYTFTTDNNLPERGEPATNADLLSMIKGGNTIPGQGARTLCLASDGMFVGGDMAVYIGAGATSSSAVEVRSNAILETDLKETTRC